jgi:hypothetical protein
VEGGAGLLKAGKSLAGVANSVDGIVEVANNISTNIHWGQQGKHIVGHNNYKAEIGKSILTSDAQGLLNNFHSGNINLLQTINSVKTRVDFG